ncbi:MAG: KH domain-containing protein [Thermoprotei archaeon]
MQRELSAAGLTVKIEGEEIIVSAEQDVAVKFADLPALLESGIPAQRLAKYFLSDEYIMRIDLQSSLGKRGLERVLGRLLGRNGSVKRKIEELSNASVYISGGVVTILGGYQEIVEAKAIVDDLVAGKPHKIALLNAEKRIARNLGLKPW